MQDQRISVRTNLLKTHARISKDGRVWKEVDVLDISCGGLGFISDVELEKSSHLRIEGEVSDFVHSMDLSCDIDIIFVSKTADGFLHGVKFRDMPKAQHTGLGVFIDLTVTKYPTLLLE